MQEFECHFLFTLVVQTHGRDEEGAGENIDRMLDEQVIQGAERIMSCGVDYDRDNIVAREVENGWFELELTWSGSWSIDEENEVKARKVAEQILDEKLTPFYQMIEIEADKRSRFELHNLKDEKITDVLIY